MPIQQAILAKKDALASTIDKPLYALAARCEIAWGDPDRLDRLLSQEIGRVPSCDYLYAWDLHGQMVSSLVERGSTDPSWRGWDLSNRPYLKNTCPSRES